MTTKKELIDSIAKRTGVKKSDAELVLNATLAEIERALLGRRQRNSTTLMSPT